MTPEQIEKAKPLLRHRALLHEHCEKLRAAAKQGAELRFSELRIVFPAFGGAESNVIDLWDTSFEGEAAQHLIGKMSSDAFTRLTKLEAELRELGVEL